MSGASETEILISGGGFVGLTLGLALKRAGIDATVVEPVPPASRTTLAFDGRVSSIAPDARVMLETLDVWRRVAEVQPVRDIVVSGGTLSGGASASFLHFDEADAGTHLFDIVENRLLLTALSEAADEAGLRIVAGRIVGAEAGRFHVTAALEDGSALQAKLLVAADGRHSALREAFGIKVTGWSYPQWGLVCTVEHERPHDGTAQEYFLPAGPFAILPMTGNRSSLVWTERADLAETYLTLSDADFADEVRRRFTDYLGTVTPVGGRWGYPLTAQLARDYIAPRFALVGDAAHVVHPIAGQGLNLGLRDVAALAEALVDADRLGLDLGSAAPLDAYQRRRRLDATAMAAMTDGLNRLFSNEIAPLKGLRETGLGIVNAVSPLRRLLARAASGAGLGETPRLLKGEAL